MYRVTIEASGGTHDVAVTVTDVDEAGTVSMDRPQPQASRPLGALLSDEDDGVVVQGWQWSRSADGTTWTDIEGATSPRRSPAPDDVDTYLRATVTYSDKFGADKTASAVSANVVEARTLSNAAPSFAEQDDDEDHPLHRGHPVRRREHGYGHSHRQGRIGAGRRRGHTVLRAAGHPRPGG